MVFDLDTTALAALGGPPYRYRSGSERSALLLESKEDHTMEGQHLLSRIAARGGSGG
jgi:hypothetical protein